MSGCVWKNVWHADTHCYVLRCVDGVSRNRPPPPWCYENGAAVIAAPSDLPVAVAAPGVGIYSMPPGGWVYGLPGDYPGAPPAFGGFFGGGPQYVRDAHTLEWIEDAPPVVTPLPAGFTPWPKAPRLEVPIPIGHGTPNPGIPTPLPPLVPVPVPEPASLALFAVMIVSALMVRKAFR